MTLDQQIQELIDNAPADGQTPQLVRIIAPSLKLLAQELENDFYYILQTSTENWILTTLSNRQQPHLEKRVIYAFPSATDALSTLGHVERAIAVPVSVIAILFQMLAIPQLDSLLFFESGGLMDQAKEIKRVDVQRLIDEQLRIFNADKNNQLSTDIA
ncbi:MAG: hypothetical protein ACRC2J_02575 [Microcoleaceae cyanobacterium]